MKPQLLALGILFCLSSCFKNDPEQQVSALKEPNYTLKTAFVDADSLHYIDVGEGEPVVFVHGTISDYRVWRGQMDTFSTNYRIIAYSRRYAYPNRQDYPDSADYSVVPHAEDLIKLIKTLNLGPVHLVGHSYGAYTSLMAALQQPELVRSLVLGEPPALSLLKQVPDGDALFNDFHQKALYPAASAFENDETERALALFLGGVIGDSSILSEVPPEVKQGWMANLPELRGTALNPVFPSIDSIDLKELDLPVLLVNGANSPPLFSAIIQELDRLLPRSELFILPNSSHGLQGENPLEFNSIVLEFIDKH